MDFVWTLLMCLVVIWIGGMIGFLCALTGIAFGTRLPWNRIMIGVVAVGFVATSTYWWVNGFTPTLIIAWIGAFGAYSLSAIAAVSGSVRDCFIRE
jgi:hypothetical protein